MALLGLVWVVALRGHGSGGGEATGSTPATPPPAAGAKAQESAAAKPTPIYKGAAPGVEGLTRDIRKAHEAVGTSQQNAQQLQRKSSEASNEAPASAGAASSSVAAQSVRHATKAHAHAKAAPAKPAQQSKAPKPTSNRPAAQIAVEREVAQGKTVLLVFWNSKSSVDREVKGQAQALVNGSKGKLAIHTAGANQVGAFGSVTEVVHVYQTPTILIVNRHGVVSTLTGLTDKFALGQIVREAEQANA